MQKLLILPLIFLLAACASQPPVVNVNTVSPRFSTAYAGGNMYISWESKPDTLYTVFYTDAPSRQKAVWYSLPQATRLRGNGQQISISDQPVTGEARRYILMTGDQHP